MSYLVENEEACVDVNNVIHDGLVLPSFPLEKEDLKTQFQKMQHNFQVNMKITETIRKQLNHMLEQGNLKHLIEELQESHKNMNEAMQLAEKKAEEFGQRLFKQFTEDAEMKSKEMNILRITQDAQAKQIDTLFDKNKENREAKSEVESLKNIVEELEAKHRKMDESSNQELESLKSRVKELVAEHRKMDKSNNEMEKELELLKNRVKELEDSEHRSQSMAKNRLLLASSIDSSTPIRTGSQLGQTPVHKGDAKAADSKENESGYFGTPPSLK